MTDNSGQPVSNATVAFTLPPLPPSKFEPSGTWVYELSDSQTYLAITDAGGIATTPEIAGDQIGGTFTVVASVSHAGSVARFTLTNDPIPTTTALSSSANPSVPGESIAFTASVTAPGEGLFVGNVQFTVDGAPLGPAVPVDLFGQATSASITLEEGKHEIAVVFAPNASFLGSSASLIQMVKPTKCSTAGCCGFAGTWDSSFGKIPFSVQGSTARGTYTNPGGTIEANIDGYVMTGSWTQHDSSGGLRFVLAADGNSFEGTWTEADGSGGGGWNGTCAGPPVGSAPQRPPATAPPTASGGPFDGLWNTDGWGPMDNSPDWQPGDRQLRGVLGDLSWQA